MTDPDRDYALIRTGLKAADAMLPYDGKLNSMAHESIASALEALDRLQALTSVNDTAGWNDAARDVMAERERQKNVEGWTEVHDDCHYDGELGLAAACYAAYPHEVRALRVRGVCQTIRKTWGSAWPWQKKWWKPKTHRENLVRAGALILAEIERLDRKAAPVLNGDKL